MPGPIPDPLPPPPNPLPPPLSSGTTDIPAGAEGLASAEGEECLALDVHALFSSRDMREGLSPHIGATEEIRRTVRRASAGTWHGTYARSSGRDKIVRCQILKRTFKGQNTGSPSRLALSRHGSFTILRTMICWVLRSDPLSIKPTSRLTCPRSWRPRRCVSQKRAVRAPDYLLNRSS